MNDGFRIGTFALGANLLFFSWTLVGCADGNNLDAGNNNDSESDGDADSGGVPGSDSDTGSDAADDTATDVDTDADTDTDTDETCTDVTTCGGHVVGSWTVTSSCLEVNGEMNLALIGLAADCVASVTGSVEVTGTWTAYDDGTYRDNTQATGTETIVFPEGCKYAGQQTVSCGRTGAVIKTAGYASIDCLDIPETHGCTCTAVIDQAGGLGTAPAYPSAEGTYTIEGSTLTIIDFDTVYSDYDREYSYCVSGTSLTLTPVGTGRTGTITGSVVLQQQ